MASRGNRRRRGTTLVEAALVLPVCLMLLFGILEYGRFVMTVQLLQNGAREGARYAVVHTHDKVTADVQNQVDQMLAGQGAQLQGYNKTTSIQVYKADPVTGSALDANSNVVTDWTQAPFTNAQFGQGIAVRISGTYNPLLPSLLKMGGSVQVSATCLMYSEAN